MKLKKMNYFFLISFSILSLVSFAQNDTDIIKRAIDYVNTDEFKNALRDSVSADIDAYSGSFTSRKKIQEFKEREWNDVAFLLNKSNCFQPKSYFYKVNPNFKLTSKMGSSSLIKMDTFSFKMKYLLPEAKKCFNSYQLIPTILNNGIIELEYLQGDEIGRIRFGTGYILRLNLNEINNPSFVALERIIYN
ncbi:MAG TPA: hypothetical protein PLP23_00075 [Panacibacter sp.]|nr:hypothetical protein [Panacibacter sp.]